MQHNSEKKDLTIKDLEKAIQELFYGKDAKWQEEQMEEMEKKGMEKMNKLMAGEAVKYEAPYQEKKSSVRNKFMIKINDGEWIEVIEGQYDKFSLEFIAMDDKEGFSQIYFTTKDGTVGMKYIKGV